jgi:mRNA interferase MazF
MVDFNPARGSEQAGERPALVVSNDIGNQHGSVVIVAAITSTIPSKQYPHCVPLPGRPQGPLPRPGTILCSQLVTVDKKRLGDFRGALSPAQVQQVNAALRASLSL